MTTLSFVTLGVAVCDADHKVREQGGNNRGVRIRGYLESLDPPIHTAAPWCAAFVAYCSDVAARALGVPNPLDAVRLEAFVQSYYDAFEGSQVGPESAVPGDLVLYRFNGSDRWNHIGLIAQPPRDGMLWAVEGNTSDADQRDGDGVYLKPRELAAQPTCFLAWDGRVSE